MAVGCRAVVEEANGEQDMEKTPCQGGDCKEALQRLQVSNPTGRYTDYSVPGRIFQLTRTTTDYSSVLSPVPAANYQHCSHRLTLIMAISLEGTRYQPFSHE